jgi:hypothetical protein
MTSTESFTLPHKQLALIPGKASAATIRQLKKELYANARSIHSDRGGGLNSHLGLVMPTAAYVIRAGAAFDEPNHPGIQPVHAAAANVAQITAANRSYDHAMDEFKTYATITEKLKKQVLSAVNPCQSRQRPSVHRPYAQAEPHCAGRTALRKLFLQPTVRLASPHPQVAGVIEQLIKFTNAVFYNST